MKVLVTGAAGRLGRWVLRDFLAQGWEVVAIDQRQIPAGETGPEGGFTIVNSDLTHADAMVGHLQGCAAVVHLAAIPTPTLGSREDVFLNNTRSSFVMLEAAAQAGVRRCVIASSTSAYGMAFAEPAFAPHYFPIDEEHPLIAGDSYALSKQVAESAAAMYHRVTAMSCVALRFHWIAAPGEGPARAAWAEGDTEFQVRRQWGYVDARDAAAACRLAVLADNSGFEAFNVVAPDVLSEQPIEDLLSRHFPDVPRRRPLRGEASAFSNEKAKRLLGWSTHHHWRDRPPH